MRQNLSPKGKDAEEEFYHCDVCGKRYETAGGLSAHKAKPHPTAKELAAKEAKRKKEKKSKDEFLLSCGT